MRITCSLAETAWCDGMSPHPSCADEPSCHGHLQPACNRRATFRLRSSTDAWPQQYACTWHRDLFVDLDVAEELQR